MRNSDKKRTLTSNQRGSLRLIAFSAVFIVIFTAVSSVFHPKDGMDTKGYSHYVTYAYRGEEKNTLDVAFIGNSNVYRAFNPIQLWDEYGITSCDIGGPALSMGAIYSCLRDMLETQNLKLVALEANCLYPYSDRNRFDAMAKTALPLYTANAAGSGKTVTVDYNKDFFTDKLDDLNDAILSKVAYEASLMKYHDRWQSLTLNDFTERDKRYYLITKGFLYSKAVQPFLHGDTYMGSPEAKSKELKSKTAEYLEKMKKLCDEKGAVFTVVCAPSGQNWNYAKHYGVQNACDSLGIEFTDYNAEIDKLDGFDWLKDRKDNGDHLNIYGATKVTAAYGKLLSEHFKIAPSKLNESQRAHWNADSKKYHEEVEKH